MKKKILIVTAALALSLGISGTSLAAGWQQNETGRWYENDDKTYPVNTWLQDPADGKWYHFDINGYMQTGWIQDNGKYYYLDIVSGAMWANTTTPDGYKLDASGAWIQESGQKTADQEKKAGWQEDNVGRWYQNSDGSYVKNRWKEINGSRYYFDESGYATVGFAEINGEEYYFSSRGVLQTKNFTIDGEVYIVNSKGVILDVVDEWDYESGQYTYKSGSNKTTSSGNKTTSGSNNTNTNTTTNSQKANSSAVEDSHNREYAEAVIDLVNEERAKEGLSPLEMNETLMGGCEIRAEELVEKFSHTRPDGSSCYTVVKDDYGYSYIGENIAEGYTSPEHVMNGWMNSSGHRANILKKEYEEIGVGCYIHNGRKYWVQLFGAQR